MKHHPAWLAAGLLVFVVLACNLSKNTNNRNSNVNSNSNSNSSTSTDTDLGSGVAIEEIHMAKDNGNGAPGDETSSFAPSDHTIHCVTKLSKPKSGTAMRFAWWIVDAGGSKNEKFKDIEYSTRGMENIVHGHLTLPKEWPAGKYKVQVYVNGDLDRTVFFSVE
jgi:hypothetical protein